MFKSLQTLFSTAVRLSNTNIEHTRSVYILRRKNDVRMSKLGGPLRKLKRRDYYYIVEENTNAKKIPLEDLLLLKNVKGIGNVGDIIKINTTKAYEYFILTGAGVLATPKNLEKYAGLKRHDAIPVEIQNLLLRLKHTPVPVFLHATNPWTLQPWHIKLSLRKIGIICNEDCIKIPDKIISGPNIDLEKKDFPITITVNKKYSVMMRCRIFHMIFSETNFEIAFNPKFYLDPIKAVFHEDQSILENIPLPKDERKIEILIED